MALRTKFREGMVARFNSVTDREDPANGMHVVVTAINPISGPLGYGDREHYRVMVPGWDHETYALAEELEPREENN